MLTCLLIGRIVGIENLISEVKLSSAFHGEKIFRICISWLAPLLLLVVLVSSVAASPRHHQNLISASRRALPLRSATRASLT